MPHQFGTTKIAATVSAIGVGALASSQAWPQQARDILVTAGVLVTGGLGILALIDHYRLNRRKEFDEANKVSLSAQLDATSKQLAAASGQLTESLSNQEHMRESLHAIRDQENKSALEKLELLAKLTEISKRLYDADQALNSTNEQLRVALRMLDESKVNQEQLRRALEVEQAKSSAHAERLSALEKASDSKVDVVVDTTPPHSHHRIKKS